MDNNTQDIELLNEKPAELIIKYQSLIDTIVSRFMRIGYFPGQEKNDVVQHINEELLNKLSYIKNQYNGKSLLKTYFIVIISNLCNTKSYIDRREVGFISMDYVEMDKLQSDELVSGIVLENEFDRYEKILMQYHNSKQKLEFCLKIYFRIPLQMKEIIDFCPEQEAVFYSHFFNSAKAGPELNGKAIYSLLTDLLNRKKATTYTEDAIRKWIRKKIEELICLMNGKPKRANYNEETIQILIEKYYASKKNN